MVFWSPHACFWASWSRQRPLPYDQLFNYNDSNEIGLLFTHWIADSLTLWKGPVTDEHLATAALYYHILTKGPSFFGWFANLAAGVTVLGGTAILWSFLDGAAGNIMFDGGSACTSFSFVLKWFNFRRIIYADTLFLLRYAVLYATAVGVYIYSVIPSMSCCFSPGYKRDSILWRRPPSSLPFNQTSCQTSPRYHHQSPPHPSRKHSRHRRSTSHPNT